MHNCGNNQYLVAVNGSGHLPGKLVRCPIPPNISEGMEITGDPWNSLLLLVSGQTISCVAHLYSLSQ